MKKTKLLACLAITTLNLGAIASCGKRENLKPEDILQQVLDDSSIITTNKTTPVRPQDAGKATELQAISGDYVKLTKAFTFLSEAGNEYPVALNWKYNKEKWIPVDQDTYIELRPKYTTAFNESDKEVVTVTASYKEATKQQAYDLVRVNNKQLIKIKDIKSGKPAAVQGYVTGFINNNIDGKLSPYGLYVQDGTDAMMVYKPSYKEVKNLKVGDLVEVLGKGDIYHDSRQIKDASVVKLIPELMEEGIKAAEITELSEIKTALNKNYNRSAKITGAKVLSVTKVAEGNTPNGILNVRIRYQGKDYLLVSDKYNDDLVAKDANYEKFKQLADSNGAKTLNFTGTIASVYEGNPKNSSDRVYEDGFNIIDNSEITIADTAYVPCYGVQASTNKTLRIGDTCTINTNVIDIEDTSCTFKSLNENIATVDATGKITGVAAGKATIEVASKVMPEIKTTVIINIAKKVALADVYNEASGSVVEVNGIYQGANVGAECEGIYFGDGEHSLFAYKGKHKGLKVGQTINVLATVELRNGALQLTYSDVKSVADDATLVAPVALTLDTDLTGIDGKDSGRAVTVIGNIVADPAKDKYGTYTFEVLLADNTSKVKIKLDNRYTTQAQLDAIATKKAGEAIKLTGNIHFNNKDNAEALNTDAKGLEIHNIKIDGVVEVPVLTAKAVQTAVGYTTTNKYAEIAELDCGFGVKVKGHLGGGTASVKQPDGTSIKYDALIFRTKVSKPAAGSTDPVTILEQSYLTNVTELAEGTKVVFDYINNGYTANALKVYVSDKAITAENLATATPVEYDQAIADGLYEYSVTMPAGKKFIYVAHYGTADQKGYNVNLSNITFLN